MRVGLSEHRAGAVPRSTVRVSVISVSDTRTSETDEGGALVEAMTREAGFSVLRRDLVPDEPSIIRDSVAALATGRGPSRPDAILLTGGTGVAPRDGTVDAVAPLFERRLDGFGELFRMLSFGEIGAAAMLSRSCAGITTDGVAVFIMPGSPAAIRLALSRLILPELGHLVSELRRANREHPDHAQNDDHHH